MVRFTYSFILLFFIPIMACQPNEEVPLPINEEDLLSFWENHVPFVVDFQTFDLAIHQGFVQEATSKGRVMLKEASGLVPSIKNPGYFWSHQDKNNDNVIFLIDGATAEIVANYRISGLLNRDWEDIEIGRSPDNDEVYLYVGEIGDNNAVYGKYKIYKFPEPVYEDEHYQTSVRLELEVEVFDFVYPEKDHDAESLLLDPLTQDLYIVTKRDVRSVVYVLPYPQSTENETTVIKVGEMFFREATAGNISQDGKHIVIKTYGNIFYWERNNEEHLTEILVREPHRLPYKPTEPQGEAICFDLENNYWTVSENSNNIEPELYFYEKK